VFKAALLILEVFLLTVTQVTPQQTHAQDSLFTPSKLEAITPTNLNRLTELAAVGFGEPGSITWSPDGRTLAVSNSYGVWLHDAGDLSKEPRFIPQPRPDVLRFSGDSSQLMTWRKNENHEPVRTWDVKTAQPIQKDWDEQGIAPNPYWHFWVDERWAGPMARRYGEITFWNIKTSEAIDSFHFDEGWAGFSISADYSVVLASGKQMVLLDMATGKPLWDRNEGSIQGVTGTQISPDGKWFISIIRDGPLVIHDTRTGDMLYPLEASRGWSKAVHFTPDSQSIIARNEQGQIRLWDVSSGSIRYTLEAQTGNLSVVGKNRFALFSPDTGQISVFDTRTGNETGAFKTDAVGSYNVLSLSPDDTRLATYNSQNTLVIWDTSTGKRIGETSRYDDVGNILAISPDGRTLLTWAAGSKPVLKLWDVQTGQVISAIPVRPSFEQINAVFHPDGKSFAVSGLGIYDLNLNLLRPFESGIWDISYSPDGKLLALAYGYDPVSGPIEEAEKGTVQITSVDTGKVLAEIPEAAASSGGFSAVAFSPDGRLLAVEGITLWSVEALLDGSHTPLATIQAEEPVSDLAFSPDGSQLVVGYALLRSGGEGFLELGSAEVAVGWNVDRILSHPGDDETRPKPDIYFIPRNEFVLGGGRTVGFTPDGSMVTIYGGGISWQGGTGSPMSLYNPRTGDDYRILVDQGSFVSSPDGKLMISTGDDRRLHYWGVPKNG
jgi:WD40 repeat protein